MDLPRLSQMFPQHPESVIENIIRIVNENNPEFAFNDEMRIEIMADMLLGQADSCQNSFDAFYDRIMGVFPDASPDYVMTFCKERNHNFDFDRACDFFIREGYSTVTRSPDDVWERLKDALPNAAPDYLKTHAIEMCDAPDFENVFSSFVGRAIEDNDYPTMKDYLTKKQESDALDCYKDENFNIYDFLKKFKNPDGFFRTNTTSYDGENDEKYAITFLYNHYNSVRKVHIERVFNAKQKKLIDICDVLDKIQYGLKRRRPFFKYSTESKNLSLLQEIAYLKHRKLIQHIKKYIDNTSNDTKQVAAECGLLMTCQTCFDSCLIPEECLTCTKGCTFCKECMQRGTEHVLSKSETKFPCFNVCDGYFDLYTLQRSLPEKTFLILLRKVQCEELKQANIDGLESCPFCNFTKIIENDAKIFKCDNPECLIESCIQCRVESHIPKRCSEIEYDEDVRRRTYIENKMTEALTRICHSCKKPFIKSSGCNKMICQCGATMCYYCSQPIDNSYAHFGDNKCPLFTQDAQLHLRRVQDGAERAKRELGNVEVKFDPTENLENFF